jgi:leucyl/phenylalanyl-tRNA---protein transferase
MRLPLLDPDTPTLFPPTHRARLEPNGLLAFGGDLRPERLVAAYCQGIFPWFNPGEPILWWAPDPRTVLWPHRLQVNARMCRWLRNACDWRISCDQAFAEVLQGCAGARAASGESAAGTWLGADMQLAYGALHALDVAHSVEVRDASGKLIAGTYGVNLGGVFFAESMFGHANNASKVALMALCAIAGELGVALIDCQVRTQHVMDRGGLELPRAQYEALLARYLKMEIGAHWRQVVDRPAAELILEHLLR